MKIVIYKKPTSIAGFSLIELMIVIGIIGILVGVGVPRFGRVIRVNRIEISKAHMKALERGLKNYYSDIHRLPARANPANDPTGLDTIAEWTAYFSTSAVQHTNDPDTNNDGQIDNWSGPYLTKIESDSWNRPYAFRDYRNSATHISAIICGGAQDNITDAAFSRINFNANPPDEIGFSVIPPDSNDYIIVLWLE